MVTVSDKIRTLPQIAFEFREQLQNSKGLECLDGDSESLCKTKAKIKNELVSKVFTLNSGDFFDQPSTARLLQGAISYINRVV